MKTIEKAARGYADEQFEEHLGVLYSECMADFTAGAEFVQKWIDINEELPEDDETVIGKKDCIFGIYKGWMLKNHIDGITHWRPIEYK